MGRVLQGHALRDGTFFRLVPMPWYSLQFRCRLDATRRYAYATAYVVVF